MFAFVILHYLSEEMTIECVNTIINTFDMRLCKIVIVDNGSENGSGKRLQDRYSELEYCSLILSERNLGFACGNNLGYVFAKESFHPDFIIIMNNDVLIHDSYFLDSILRIYNETKFHVLGPDILASSNGVHQNPMKAQGYGRQEIQKIIHDRIRWLKFYPFHYSYHYSKNKLKEKISKLIGRKKRFDSNILAMEKRIINPVLHGACYIFSRNFIEQEEYPFHPDTFLYFEEDILHYNCRRNQYLMLYDSSILVEHKEDVSTNQRYSSYYEKCKMKYENLVHSAQVLLNLMQEEEN